MAIDLDWSDDPNRRLIVDIDGQGQRDVYICSLHKEKARLPFFDKWQDPELKSWIAQYQPLPNAKPDNPEFGDELNAVSRDDRWGLQAIFKGYQLYIYNGGDTGEASGFWEFAREDRMDTPPASPDEPINPPQPARGP